MEETSWSQQGGFLEAPPPTHPHLSSQEQSRQTNRNRKRRQVTVSLSQERSSHGRDGSRYLKSSMRDPKKLRKLLCRLMWLSSSNFMFPKTWMRKTAESPEPSVSSGTCRVRGTMVKNPSANAGDARDAGSIPGSGTSCAGRYGKPTPVFLPGKPHGQRSLAGYSPWGHKESNPTEHMLAGAVASPTWLLLMA